jgi:hypothetical protein
MTVPRSRSDRVCGSGMVLASDIISVAYNRTSEGFNEVQYFVHSLDSFIEPTFLPS